MGYHRATQAQLQDGDAQFLAEQGRYLRRVVRLLTQIAHPRWQEQAEQERMWDGGGDIAEDET